MKEIKHSRKILLAAVMAMAWSVLGMTAAAAPEEPVKKTYVVDKNGTGDFETIQAGVDQASDGDTLIIYPGIYTEEVMVMDKELNLIGTNRDLCVIQCDATSYMHMPLTIGAGKVSNLTIYGMSDKQAQKPGLDDAAYDDMFFLDWQKGYPGYAVHIDQNALYKHSLSFENCRIVSENSNCVGIGGRGESSITFENCEMISLRGGGCIFLHDSVFPMKCGEMALILKNCSLTSCLGPYVMTFWSHMPEANSLKLTFQNTRVSAVAYEYGYCYTPFNENSFLSVDELMQLEDNGSLYMAGLTSTAEELVHELTLLESGSYVAKINELAEKENAIDPLEDILPEGITYLRIESEEENTAVKRQVIAVYNRNSTPEIGWCGLNGAYLTPDSFGNTLPEMNALPALINREVLH